MTNTIVASVDHHGPKVAVIDQYGSEICVRPDETGIVALIEGLVNLLPADSTVRQLFTDRFGLSSRKTHSIAVGFDELALFVSIADLNLGDAVVDPISNRVRRVTRIDDGLPGEPVLVVFRDDHANALILDRQMLIQLVDMDRLHAEALEMHQAR